ncbi:MAG TPA: M20 family metallo-hydrolase [Acidisarcina sp.]
MQLPLDLTLVDSNLLQAELSKLATYSQAEAPAVTRVVYSVQDLEARAYLKGLFMGAGLEVRQDAVGNIFARWPGENEARPAVGTGSHVDAIPNAGMYDGTVGVLGSLEAIRVLKRSGFRPLRSIELLMFTSEEPTRFGIGCLGSRLLSGALSPEAARALKDNDGHSLDKARANAGFTGMLEEVALPAGYFSHFLELHIEQGKILESEGASIGVVESIAAPASLRILVEGEGGHAGGVLMPDRRDALTGAAEIVLAVERLARATGSVDTVATVGMCEVSPGAVNSIPSRVTLWVDLRDTELARRDGVLNEILSTCSAVAERRGIAIQHEMLNADAPTECSPEITGLIASSCRRQGIRHRAIVSRAYHDSLFISRIAEVGMIFIPCRGGVSHRPDEYASPEDIARGVLVLAETLGALAGAV